MRIDKVLDRLISGLSYCDRRKLQQLRHSSALLP
jgi:hypothetical protein